SPEPDQVWCPSAQPDWPGAVAHAIISGTAQEPRARPLERTIAVTPDLLQLAAPVEPTEVFRFGAPCLGSGCQHHQGDHCGLGQKVARKWPIVLSRLPACTIRAHCRWFREEGSGVCRKCPQVVTDNVLPDPLMRWVADTKTTLE